MFEIIYYCDNSRHKGMEGRKLKAPYLQITSDGRAGLVKTTGNKVVSEDVDPLDMFLQFCNTECMKDYIDDKFWPLKSTKDHEKSNTEN